MQQLRDEQQLERGGAGGSSGKSPAHGAKHSGAGGSAGFSFRCHAMCAFVCTTAEPHSSSHGACSMTSGHQTDAFI